jgi:hypothetical protein
MFTDGTSALVVAALASEQADGPTIDSEMTGLATALVRARWLN